MTKEYSYTNFPLDVVQVICDDCLTCCEVKRGGYNSCVYILKCLCSRRQMEVHGYRFTTGDSNRVLASTFLKPSSRTPGRYGNDPDEVRLLIELDTGILLEDVEDVKFFIWATNNGHLPFAELERRATRLMEIYARFKHLQGAPEPTVPEDKPTEEPVSGITRQKTLSSKLMKTREELLKWRVRQYDGELTPERLADSFSVEALPYRSIPITYHEALTAFRHLSQKARQAACRAFLARIGHTRG